MKKVSVLALLFALLVSYLFIFDEPLNVNAANVLKHYNHNHTIENNGSVYQLGLWSEISESPMQIGKWRIAQYQDAIRKSTEEEVEFEDYAGSIITQEIFQGKSKPALLCNIKESACVNYIQLNIDLIPSLLADKSLFIERYDNALSFNTYTLYEKPSYNLPTPTYGNNSDLLKLKLLGLIKQTQEEKYQESATEIAHIISTHKKILAQTPYLAPKIMSIVELELTIDTLSLLLSKTHKSHIAQWQPILTALKPLNSAQLSMEKPFFYEFVSLVNTLETIDVEDYKDELIENINFLPSRILYKQNKTINMLYQWMTSNQNLMSYNNNRIITKESPVIDNILAYDLMNPMGSLLAMSIAPRLLHLEPFLYKIDVKQKMLMYQFNQKLSTLPKNKKKEFISPYTGEPSYIADGFLCVSKNTNLNEDICIHALE